MRRYRRRVKQEEPWQHLLSKCKDRVRKRLANYEKYGLDKKKRRITQSVIYKLYLKFYNFEGSGRILFSEHWKPDLYHEPENSYFLCKQEVIYFREAYTKEESN